MISLILLVFSFVIACIAASPWAAAEPNRTRLIAVALAFWFAASIFGNSVIASRLGQ